MVGPFEEGWTPAQAEPRRVVDLRGAAFGPRGYKVKNQERFARKRKAEDMDVDQQPRPQVASEDIMTVREAKKSKLNIVGAAKVSQRIWKVPGDRAADMMYHTMKTTWEAKMQDKQGRKEFQEIVRNSKMAYGQKQKAIRKQRQLARERKEENAKKSAVVQKISNPKTLKKMMGSKKQRSKLMMADTN